MSQVVMLVSLITKKFKYTHDTVKLKTLGIYSVITDGPSTEADLYMKETDSPFFSIGLTWLLNYLLHLSIHICTKLNETSEKISSFR